MKQMLLFCVLLIFSAISYGQKKKSTNELSEYLSALKTNYRQNNSINCHGNCELIKFSYRLSVSEIDKMVANTLLDLLEQIPGIIVIRDQTSSPHISINGVTGKGRVQFLVNGVRQDNPIDGSMFLSIPARMIDHIDIYYGPDGVWFGEGALVGTIAVITKNQSQVRQYSYVENNSSYGAGLFAANKQEHIRSGIYAGFSSQKIDENIFKPKDLSLWASGFIETKISNHPKTHLLLRTSYARYNAHLNSSNLNYLSFTNDLRLLQKKSSQNSLEIFVSSSIFNNKSSLKEHSNSQALRIDTGSKFNFSPLPGHNLFSGFGAHLSQLMHTKNATNAYLYAFIQDEWKIKLPIKVVMGTRFHLPLKNKKLFVEILPTIGILITPISNLALKLIAQKSLSSPLLTEKDFYHNEKNHTLQSSIRYTSSINNVQFRTGLAFFWSMISDNKNNKQLNVFGASISGEITFPQGHGVTFDASYSHTHNKIFDTQGYAKCKAGLFDPFLDLPLCSIDNNIPKLSIHSKAYFDLLSYGNINLSSLLVSSRAHKNFLANYYSLFKISYISRSFLKYIYIFANLNINVGGRVLQKNNPDKYLPGDFSLNQLNTMIGLEIRI